MNEAGHISDLAWVKVNGDADISAVGETWGEGGKGGPMSLLPISSYLDFFFLLLI